MAQQTARLPVRLGGIGLRPVAPSLHIAYFSAAALAAPGIVLLCPPDRREATFADHQHFGFTATVAQALDEVRRRLPGEHRLLPATMAAFWRLYGVQGMAKKLQSAISSQTDLKELQDLINGRETERADRQRLASAGSRNAGAWLTLIPRDPELRLTDKEYRQAMRLRLGLPVGENLPRRCVCNADLRKEPCHFFWCGQLKTNAVTTRHDRMVRSLAALFTAAGASRG